MTFVAGIREDAKTILIFGIKKSRKKRNFGLKNGYVGVVVVGL